MSIGTFDSVVDRMMASYGGAATLKTYSEGVYVDGENIVQEFPFSVKVLINEYPQSGAGDKQEFNTLILAGDKQCFMQPVEKVNSLVIPPDLKANRDKLQVGAIEWKILNVKQVNPSGANNVLYELHIRK